MTKDNFEEATRRAILKGAAATLGVGIAGSAAGHPSEDGKHQANDGAHEIHRHDRSESAELVGYHSLGDIGSESTSGEADEAMHGMVTDVWVEGDLGFLAIQSSSAPTGNRGVAILDVSPYTRAESRGELDDAEMTVLSFIGNESEAGTANDVKVSNDQQILAYSKQSIGADYGEPASASTDTHSAPGAEPQGVIAYDISDPENPEYIGSATGPNVGFHNCFVHQIGGDYYVFGIQGAIPGSAAVHVYRVTEAGLELIDIWGGDDLPVTSLGTEGASFYCHDFYAHDDPVSGKPLGFIAYWDYGGVVLDLSDPRNITALGRGTGVPRTHYVQPAPAEVGGKRLLIGGQEHRDQTNDISGIIAAWDVDAIVEDDGFTEVDPLAEYTLYDKVTYEGYAFSPHNNDVVVDGDDAWITQSHYHAGIRFLKIQPPGEGEVNAGDWHIAGRRVRSSDGDPIRQETADLDGDGEEEFVQEFETDANGVFTSGFENAFLEEEAQAYYSAHIEVPDETKTDDNVTPNFWSARSLNGVTFGGNQHSGLYAVAADPMEVGTRTAADVAVTRTDDGSVFTAGQTDRIDYSVRTNEDVKIRDRLPSDWEVVGGDAVTTYDTGDGLTVEFDKPVTGRSGSRTLFVTVNGAANEQVGPVQFSAEDDPSKGGKDWETLADSVETLFVAPVST